MEPKTSAHQHSATCAPEIERMRTIRAPPLARPTVPLAPPRALSSSRTPRRAATPIGAPKQHEIVSKSETNPRSAVAATRHLRVGNRC